jgi:hypothetical protein|tara:strand:- start:164 stop:349 length:186 start_codon:yes stop_codon:yes gene_type:complete
MYNKFNFKNMTLETAEEEIYALQGSQFGHNIIGLILSEVANKFGKDAAEELKINTDAYGGC